MKQGSIHWHKPAVIIQGKGSEIVSEKTLKGKAKRKVIAQKLALVDIANKKGDAEMAKSFWNTYHCQSNIVSHEGKLYGKYCKNRHYPLCCGIRKATLINHYLPVVQQWSNPYFVKPLFMACTAKQIRKRLQAMNRSFAIITTKYRKQAGKSTL